MLDKEIIEKAKQYKKRIAGSFVLVDGNEISGKITGSQFVATKKIDGSLYGLFFEEGAVLGVSTTGRIIKDLPCLKEAADLLKARGIGSAVIEAELYAVLEDGKRERVGDVSKAMADKSLWDRLFLAPFDIVMLDGGDYRKDNYIETIKELGSIFDGKLVRAVEYREASSKDEVASIYREWVEEGGAEGIVLHSELPFVYKIKPHHTIDAVIVGFTCGEGDDSDGVRDIAVALMNEKGQLQIIGVTGNGFTNEQRRQLLKDLEPMVCQSEYIITDSRNVAFQMVKPSIIIEVSVGDFISEASDGTPKMNPLLTFSESDGYLSEGNTPGVSILHMTFVRFRDDKSFNESDIRISQVTDVCPFSQGNSVKLNGLPKSEILAKRIFTKGSGEKMMVQKYVVWKTNKEESSLFPAYVFFYTDFSSGRKDMLKRDIRVSSDKEQIIAFMDAAIAQNVKKGWTEKA